MNAQVVVCTLLLCLLPFCVSGSVYHVIPTEDTPCPGDTCHTLDYYMQGTPGYFTSDSVVHFLPGKHTLTVAGVFQVENVQNITFIGSNLMSVPTTAVDSVPFWPTSSVYCTNGSGFRFWNATDVIIANLSFTYCGVLMYLPSSALTLLKGVSYDYIYTALAFDRVSNITIYGLIVQSSKGHGLVVTNMRGSVTVTKSAFISNGVNKTYWGGNALFNHFDGDKFDCLEASTVPFTLTVESSYFMYGETTASEFTAGMQINVLNSCSDIHIFINHSVFLGNHHHGPLGGGNLELVIVENYNRSVSQNIIIDNSYIAEGLSHTLLGIQKCAGMFIVYVHYMCEVVEHGDASYLWRISNSNFVGNLALFGGSGGLMLGAECTTLAHQILLHNNTFSENTARIESIIDNLLLGLAHIYIAITRFIISSVNNIVSPTIAINSCSFQNGMGGGIHVDVTALSKLLVTKHKHTLLQVTDTQFINNEDKKFSGTSSGISIGLDHRGTDVNFYEIEINNCTFANNSCPTMLVFPFRNAIYYRDFQPFSFIVQNVTWKDSTIDRYSTTQYFNEDKPSPREGFGAVVFVNVQNATFIDCNIQGNQDTALKVAGSILHFQRTTRFTENTGFLGGAISIYNSYLFLKLNSTLLFTNNSAFIGGALYVEQQEISDLYCFFQVDKPRDVPITDIGTRMIFTDNTATSAGSVLYGGKVDSCLQNFVNEYPPDYSLKQEVLQRTAIFDQVFDYSSQYGLSVIASFPTAVCFCNSSQLPECAVQTVERDIFPGESFNVSAVVVGQREGVGPGSIVAYFKQSPMSNSSSVIGSLDPLERVQSVSSVCSVLTYTVSSISRVAYLNLEVDSTAREGAIPWQSSPKLVKILLRPCPVELGFQLSKITGKCECAHPLSDYHFTCTIQNKTLYLPGGVWIGYHSAESSTSGVLLHKHCPIDYCKQEDNAINLEYPDEQCAFNRSGTLCGACQQGLSLALGTSRCLRCSNAFIAMFLVFALAGILLVLFLILLNLTISEGTLSGLIFYANIVHVNQAIFFRSSDQASTTAARVFVAWLNLDLGIETCFCNGMDMYVKTWLQFAFPIYVWLIVLAMIVSGHYSTTAARVFSRNAVKVLATLFLLAYAKLQRTIITAVSYTSMVYPDSSRRFHWLYDGNIRYLHGKHIPLFMAAVLAFLILSVPYTVVLFFLQCLMKSQSRVFFWVNKWKPLFDAYTGPFKDKYRFWTGLLLAFRSVLLLIFAFNVEGDPAVNLLSIVLCGYTLCGVLLFGIYKSQVLNILEFSFILNLGTLSAVTTYIRLAGGSQAAAINTSFGIAFATFIGIIGYHMYKRLSTLQLLQSLVRWYRERRHPTLNDQDLQLVDLAAQPPEVPYTEYHEQPVRPPRVTRMRLVLGENNEAMLVTDQD